MDPLTSLVTALAAGAAVALKTTVEQVVKDSYAALKALIQRKYAQVNIDLLEQQPASESRQGVVEEDLAKTEAASDAELLRMAKVLLDAIQRHTSDTTGAVGVDLKQCVPSRPRGPGHSGWFPVMTSGVLRTAVCSSVFENTIASIWPCAHTPSYLKR